MPLYPCRDCGQLTTQRRCPQHQGNTSWGHNRNRTAQATFRTALLARYDNQCAAVEHGQRCPITTELQAHHLRPGDNNPDAGVLLCRHHHRAIDKQAR